MRLTLVISSLSSGGAERVITFMANYWSMRDWPVTLLAFDGGSEAPFYTIHSKVALITLGITSKSKNALDAFAANLKRIRTLRRAVLQTRPGAVISFIDTTNVITLLATRFTSVPVIVSERSDPRHAPIGRLWGLLRWFCYRFANCVVVQSESVRSFFPPALQPSVRAVPNPVMKPPPGRAHQPHGGAKSVCAMGRLAPEKGFDLLIRAFAKVADKHRDWTLTIWGEGGERGALEKLRDEVGLQNRIRLPGRTGEPFEKLCEADLFVLPSRFEGFPNALCEAMACGLPVISFDCPSGPREIVRDGADGILVPPESVEALAGAIGRLLSDEVERRRLGANAPAILHRFSLEKVMAMWEEILESAINGKPV